MKKRISLLLALILSACVFAPSATAEEAAPLIFGDYEYTLTEDGGARVTRYLGDAEEAIIPEALDGHAVREIGDFAFIGCGIHRVEVPEGVESIGDWAFKSCFALKSAALPDSVKRIGRGAFSYCVAFTEADIPPLVTCIEDDTFMECHSLARATIPESVASIGNAAFWRCNALTELSISEGVERIGDDAFFYCDALTSVTIPDSVTDIGANPFAFCGRLTAFQVSADHPYLSVVDGVLFSKPDRRLICYPHSFPSERYEIPQGTKIIGAHAFDKCTALETVEIPDGVETIEKISVLLLHEPEKHNDSRRRRAH